MQVEKGLVTSARGCQVTGLTEEPPSPQSYRQEPLPSAAKRYEQLQVVEKAASSRVNSLCAPSYRSSGRRRAWMGAWHCRVAKRYVGGEKPGRPEALDKALQKLKPQRRAGDAAASCERLV